ncbi:hypothetical protein GCM10011514_07630 [Emticicia aquatilis]|uniref:Uncharacterized protein n=1 Tax=Emticicia aquatilis TaxID=1537369 RepID=A0A917DL04_9BACT|nr:hypothetical protein [Emticicia aquatilis]GGD46078.1 hypothetical protein GCM10011514_07630 [Emticicia aquatilis]
MTLQKRFDQIPIELKVFAAFAIIVTFLSFLLPLILEKELWQKTIKYTGWSPATTYMFCIVMVFSSVFRNNHPKHIIPRMGIVLLLSIQIYFGSQQQLLVDERRNFTNPYLIISEYQYIWTILIPAFWLLVILLSPNIKRFYRAISQKSN